MRKTCLLASVIVSLCVACKSPAPAAVPTPTPAPTPAIVSATGYRPVQAGDVVEGAKIGYQYLLPSQERPVVVIAFGEQLLELMSIKPELSDGLVAYIQELTKEPTTIYAFDEADPSQNEPKLLTLDANKPVEIVIFPIQQDFTHTWSVTETQEGEVRAAYKLIRRKDGGLRFVDAYGTEALNSFTTLITLNGGGAGLVFSSRLALLRLILTDPAYQRGADVMASHPPAVSQYDPRILMIDPSQKGLAQDITWVLVSRPGPNPGLIAP
jgi:hypothetical protein